MMLVMCPSLGLCPAGACPASTQIQQLTYRAWGPPGTQARRAAACHGARTPCNSVYIVLLPPQTAIGQWGHTSTPWRGRLSSPCPPPSATTTTLISCRTHSRICLHGDDRGITGTHAIRMCIGGEGSSPSTHTACALGVPLARTSLRLRAEIAVVCCLCQCPAIFSF